MKIMERDIEILIALANSGFMTSSQIHCLLFPNTIQKVTTKRMRKLLHRGLVKRFRPSRMEDNLYTLSAKGRTLLLSETGIPDNSIICLKQIPAEFKHSLTVSNIKICFQSQVTKAGADLKFIFTDQDLHCKNPNSPVIPDLIVRFIYQETDHRLLVEVDLGTENVLYFARKKMRNYLNSIDSGQSIFGLTEFRILVFTKNQQRLQRLIEATSTLNPPEGLIFFAVIPNLHVSNQILKAIYVDASNPKAGYQYAFRLVPQGGPTKDQPEDYLSSEKDHLRDQNISNISSHSSSVTGRGEAC